MSLDRAPTQAVDVLSPLPGGVASPEDLAATLVRFFERHPAGVVLEDGKPLFELETAQHRISAEHGRCSLQLWDEKSNFVRTVISAVERAGTLRLQTRRFGHAGTKALTLAPALERREPRQRESARQHYTKLLQRVLAREFPDWQVEAFRAAMDLERSFGPAYARGSQTRGKEAWAVIGIGAGETATVIDGILTLGILWLHHSRERSEGKRLYKGLRLIVPRGTAALTLARMPWLNAALAQWELFELDERSEELTPCDPADQGNLRTRLVQHPDEEAARERFASAVSSVLSLIPKGQEHRVEQRLRSPAEIAFLLHGLEFARARISLAPGTFTHTLQVTVGIGPAETALTDGTRRQLIEHVETLFARRHPDVTSNARMPRAHAPGRGIGAFTGRPAHARQGLDLSDSIASTTRPLDRLEARERRLAAQQDPLFRALPERWLESVLRENLAPLTRYLAPSPQMATHRTVHEFANDFDPDTRGNRADTQPAHDAWSFRSGVRNRARDCLIPRFDPRFAYTQVPAIAGAGDRGMLDLLGLTEDGRLAVIELKASDDLQLALQGLDYWIRVRHHHATDSNSATQSMSVNDLQRHGYFRGVALSPQPPRLYLVAPALHIHPATETILRYLSPRVEWHLLALDERWRQEIRVVWRKSGGQPPRGGPA